VTLEASSAHARAEVRAGSALGTRSPFAQLAALLRLRHSLLGPVAQRLSLLALAVVALLGPATLLLGAWAAPRLPPEQQTQATELLAGSYLILLLGLVVAAVAASGGRELFPRQQLVAYPFSPFTDHLGALALTPLSLAWLLQVLGLSLVTGVAAGVTSNRVAEPAGAGSWSGVLLAGAVTAGWVLVATALAQAAAWVVELVRAHRSGRWWLRGLSVLGVLGVWASTDDETLVQVLDRTPTAVVSEAGLQAAGGTWAPAVLTLLGLCATAAVLVLVGGWIYVALAHQPSRDQARQETHHHRAHRLPPAGQWGSDVRSWSRTDWAGVWRSPPLRRGLIVLVVAPVAGGLLARVEATDLVLLTAVVASGSGLLFGVNAFCLDGEGAPWRESLPVPARTWVVARALVLAQLVAGAALLATLAAALSGAAALDSTSALAALVGLVAMTGQVTARCLRWSMTSPHRAELRTTRDSPASPGQMASYSAQLVLATIGLGILLSIAARLDQPLLVLLVVTPSLLLSARSIAASLRRWDDPAVRARVVQAVSRG